VDYFEHRETPFIVAANCFDGARRYETDDIRIALGLEPHVPIVLCDARRRESVKQVLIASVNHSLQQRQNRLDLETAGRQPC